MASEITNALYGDQSGWVPYWLKTAFWPQEFDPIPCSPGTADSSRLKVLPVTCTFCVFQRHRS